MKCSRYEPEFGLDKGNHEWGSDCKKSNPSRSDSFALWANFITPMLVLIILGISTGCSVKKDGAEDSLVSGSDGLNVPVVNDKDRDGLSDELERALGRDELTGNFPTFTLENFSETKLEITDFSNVDNKIAATYRIDESIGSNLSFTPLNDKLAKHAYTRTVGQTERPAAIDIYDLSIVKVSNFSYVDTLNVRNFMKLNESNLDSTSVRIESRFYIRASEILGVTKINNVKAELGFLDSNGGFASFGNIFDLMTTSNTRLIFSSRGDANSTKSNMEALIFVDRLPIETLSYILENDLQLALKIVDYSVELVNGSSFKFSSQVQESLANTALFSISTPAKDYLFFNARRESIEHTLNRLFGGIETDGEGTLLRTSYYENNSSYPIRYEELGNEHLREKSWHLFSENDKTTDVPNVGESVMLGFFTNSYIAKMGGRMIRLDAKEHSSKKIEHEINALNIGEVVEIRVSGSDYTETPSAARIVQSQYSYYECACSGRFCHKSDNKCVEPVWPRAFCSHGWIDLIRKNVNLMENTSLNQIYFTSKKIKNPISLSNIIFFKKQVATRDVNEGEWYLKIVVDEEFISEFGDSIKLMAAHEQKIFAYGHNGWGNCPSTVRDFKLINPAMGQRGQGDSAPTRNYKISIKRSFTR